MAHAQTRNIFLAIDYDEQAKKTLLDALSLPLAHEEIRREKWRNLHLTLGYIRSVENEDRHHIIDAFEELKAYTPFTIQAEDAIALGPQVNVLCARLGPYETLYHLRQKAEILLMRHTSYRFDHTFTDFIPHTKIQSIRGSVSEERKQDIITLFKNQPYRKLRFKIKSVALMERYEDNYSIVKRYMFSKPYSASESPHDVKADFDYFPSARD